MRGGSRRRKDIGSHKDMLFVKATYDTCMHTSGLFLVFSSSPQSLSHYRTKRGHDFSSVACTPRTYWPATAAADGGEGAEGAEGGGGANRPGA
jgi:hypothetical protein